jgi:NADH-quinone oxidoreductase subunit G
MRQSADRALSAEGASRPAWEILGRLARALGYEATWKTLRDVRGKVLPDDEARPAGSGGATPMQTPHTTEAV